MSKIYCFGNTQNGELGLGGIEEDCILSPRKQRMPYDRRSYALVGVATGRYHTLMLLRSLAQERNVVFSCGSNERKQLGRAGSWTRLEQVEGLTHQNIFKIACGSNFSMGLTEVGQVFTWGCNLFGQLGLGSVEEQEIGKPSLVKKLATKHVVQIACGGNHCLALTKNSELYSWGSNAFGQLGHGTSGNCIRIPTIIASLKWTPIVEMALGGSHSAALSYTGALYMWGKNEFGQLGLSDTKNRVLPTLQRSLRNQKVVHVSLGEEHSATLTNEGGLFTFGAGMFGQLGHGRNTNELLPLKVFELMGVEIVQVSCGRCHTLAANKCGRVYSFGLNGSGQLGLGMTQSKSVPIEVRGPWSEINVRDLLLRNSNRSLCTVNEEIDKKFSSNDDGYFTPSEDSSRNKKESKLEEKEKEDDVTSDMEIDEFTDENVGTDSCNDNCVIEEPDDIVITDFENIPVFLCTNDNTVFTRKDRFLEIDEYESDPDSDIGDGPQQSQLVLYEVIASLGDQSFILVQQYTESSKPVDHRQIDPSSEILKLDNSIFEKFKYVVKEGAIPLEVVDYIEEVFASVPCWNASYLEGRVGSYDENMNQLCKYMSGLGIKANNSMEKNNCFIDWSQAFHGFNMIEDAQHVRINELIYQNLVHLLNNMPDVLIKSSTKPESYLDEEVLRIYQILPLSHMFRMNDINDDLAQNLITLYAKAILTLSKSGLDCLQMKWCSLNKRYLKTLINIFKKSIELNLLEQHNENTEAAQQKISKEQQFRKLKRNIHENLLVCLKVLKLLFNTNKVTQTLSYKDFYIPGIGDMFDLTQDYIGWKKSRPLVNDGLNYLCNYSFIFDPPAKNIILATDSAMQKQSAAQSSVCAQLISNFSLAQTSQGVIYVNPYLTLTVHRQNILQETINQLCTITKNSDHGLKQPLQVNFEGEEAIDAGQGMKKEFFLLLMKEILDKKYGMFTEYPETQSIWFHHSNDDDLIMYTLIGILCGLAIYNNVIINLPFSLVLYKKLLKEKLELEDLSNLDPLLTKNLKDMLDTPFEQPEFDAIFGDLNFVITLTTYGTPLEFELCQGGKSRTLNYKNRHEYVDLYWKFILIDSIEKQFNALDAGFMKVLDKDVLGIFHAEELMQLVSGQEVIDWEELEAATEYTAPFTKDHPTIKLFWLVFHGLTNEERKKFLLFLTGSDRIPILGVKALNLVIQPMKVDDDHLPVAHTCFNILDLPQDYEGENRDTKLREKLLKACEYSHGFALV